jgi:hypothetical protein
MYVCMYDVQYTPSILHQHTHTYIHKYTYTHIHIHIYTYTYTNTILRCGPDKRAIVGDMRGGGAVQRQPAAGGTGNTCYTINTTILYYNTILYLRITILTILYRINDV